MWHSYAMLLWHHISGSTLVQVMVRRLFGTKPLPEPTVTKLSLNPIYEDPVVFKSDWPIDKWILKLWLQWNLQSKLVIFFQDNASEMSYVKWWLFYSNPIVLKQLQYYMIAWYQFFRRGYWWFGTRPSVISTMTSGARFIIKTQSYLLWRTALSQCS